MAKGKKVYTARIEKLERGNRGDMQGLWVTLYDVTNKQMSKYPDFCSDAYENEYAAVFENAGQGSLVEVTKVQSEKNPKYWNIRKVTAVDDVGEPEPETEQPAPPTKTEVKEAVVQRMVAPPEPTKKVGNGHESIWLAIDLVGRIIQAENLKKALPASKVTEDMILDFTLQAAYKIEQYMRGEYTPVVESDTVDLKKEPVDAGETDIPETDGEADPADFD